MHTSIRRSPRLLAAAALAAALAGPAVAAAVQASPAQAATPACRASQLVAWLDTNGNGAAGTIFYTLNLTNVGQTCTVRGYPGISAVNQRGRQIGLSARRNSVTKVHTVTLRGTAGGDPTNATTAQATVAIVEAGNFPATTCNEQTASGLRVYAPNQSSASFVAFPFATCSGTRDRILSITALKR